MNIRNLLVTAALAALSSAAFAQTWTTVYSEDFTGLAKVTTGDINNAQGIGTSNSFWYSNSITAQSVGTIDGAALRVRGNTGHYAYLGDYGMPSVDLSNASTSGIRVSFDMQMNVTATSQSRLFLLNTQADPTYSRGTLNTSGIATIGSGGVTEPNTSQPFLTWTGYSFMFASTSTGSTANITQKIANNTGIFSNSNDWVNLDSPALNSDGAWEGGAALQSVSTTVFGTANVWHFDIQVIMLDADSLSFSYIITNRATGDILNSIQYTTSSIGDGAWTDGTNTLMGGFKFDTVAFATGSNPQMSVDNLVVQTTIPEPATYAAALGALSLLVVGYRRFRR